MGMDKQLDRIEAIVGDIETIVAPMAADLREFLRGDPVLGEAYETFRSMLRQMERNGVKSKDPVP